MGERGQAGESRQRVELVYRAAQCYSPARIVRIYAYRFAKDQQTRRDARPIRAAVPAAAAAALRRGSIQEETQHKQRR